MSHDPYHAGLEIGAMYRPRGNIRKVIWYQGSGFSGPDDPDGWEKRVVQRYDETGRCVEIENWSTGFREFRRLLPGDRDPDPTVEVSWENGLPCRCWRRHLRFDAAGHLLASIRTPLTPEGCLPSVPTPIVETEYRCDGSGAILEAIDRSEDGSAVHRSLWDYDRKGRLHRVVREDCNTGQELTDEFEYDADSRVVGHTRRVRGDPRVHRSEFELEDGGRVLLRRDSIDGIINTTTACEYDPKGNLLSRRTLDLHLDPSRNRRTSQWIEETFDGVDRPLTRNPYDLNGRLEESVLWEYRFDERGNWIRKTDFSTTVGRLIEYAD